jgi:hypothetical protein
MQQLKVQFQYESDTQVHVHVQSLFFPLKRPDHETVCDTEFVQLVARSQTCDDKHEIN